MPSELVCLPKLPPPDRLSAQYFLDRIAQVHDDIIDIAREYVAALDARPALAGEMADLGASRETLYRMERCGRGQLHRLLMFPESPGAARLGRMPLSEQTRALEQGIDVLDPDETTTRKIPLNEMTPLQARQVFAREGIRTLAQQRTWLREQKARLVPVDPPSDIRFQRGYVIIARPGKYSRATLLQWLGEMN